MNLTRQTLFVASSRAATQGATMLCSMVVGHLLSLEIAGLVQKCMLVINICVLIGMFGIQTALFTQLPKSCHEHRRGIIVQSLSLLFFTGAFLCIVLILGQTRVADLLNTTEELSRLLPLAGIAVWLALLSGVTEPLLIVEGRPNKLLLTSIPAAVLQVGILLFFTDSPHQMPYAMILGLIISSLWRLLIVSHHLLLKMAGNWWPSDARTSFIEQLSFLVPVGMVSAIDTIATTLDRNIVAHYFPSDQFSLYAYGAMEIPLLGLLIGSVTPVLLPQLSQLYHQSNVDKMISLWHRATVKISIPLWGIFFCFMCIAPQFLELFYSEKYRDSALYMRIYLFLLPLRAITFMPILYAINRKKAVLVGSIIDLIFNLVLGLTLIQYTPLGMSGASVATVVGTTIQSLFYLSIIKSTLHQKWNSLLPWKTLFSLLLMALFCYIPAIICVTFCPNTYVIILTAILCFVIYMYWALRRYSLI